MIPGRPGPGYLVNTSDRARSVRAATFDDTIRVLGRAVKLKRVEADYIARRPDVLFYITGAAWVRQLATNHFRPGAVGDHLTSTGGELTDSHQMSSLRWLEAGATGSYGSVIEPCNLPAKFPAPPVLIASYLSGATLIEAYWKSVHMPGQGIFIGEPLARPFGGYEVTPRGRPLGSSDLCAAAGPLSAAGRRDASRPLSDRWRIRQARLRAAAADAARGHAALLPRGSISMNRAGARKINPSPFLVAP